MTTDEAEAVAIEALGFIAGDMKLLGRFLMFTGLRPAGIRLAAQEPGFLTGVLRFLVGHEPDLVAFAAEVNRAPESVRTAALALGAMEPA